MNHPYREPPPAEPPKKKPWLCRIGFHFWVPRLWMEYGPHDCGGDLHARAECRRCGYSLPTISDKD
jgi:hypothetical protein